MPGARKNEVAIKQGPEVAAVLKWQSLPECGLFGAHSFEEFSIVTFTHQQIDLMGCIVSIDLGKHAFAEPVTFQAQGFSNGFGGVEACRQLHELVARQVQHQRFSHQFQALG
ncbi:hypothetical protein D3C81_1457030 [compost metagenome]